jgi:hypothetical protein
MGRSLDHSIGVLHESVSREHSLLCREDSKWHVRDLGSKNGLLVNGELVRGRAAIEHGAILHIGSVPFFFLTDGEQLSGEVSRALATATVSRGDIFRCSMQDPETRQAVQLVGGGGELAAPGVLLIRKGDASWSELHLSPLEFALLRLLAVRAQSVARSGAPTSEAHVPTAELARRLPFRSSSADAENVRQAVRRVRRTLAELGLENLIGAIQGRGYRIAWPVEA